MYFQYGITEAIYACCVYNMTQVTLNSEKIIGCAQKVHDANKSRR